MNKEKIIELIEDAVKEDILVVSPSLENDICVSISLDKVSNVMTRMFLSELKNNSRMRVFKSNRTVYHFSDCTVSVKM